MASSTRHALAASLVGLLVVGPMSSAMMKMMLGLAAVWLIGSNLWPCCWPQPAPTASPTQSKIAGAVFRYVLINLRRIIT